MKKLIAVLVVMFAVAASVMAAPPDRWIHISVVSADAKDETVRINVPMSFAEKVLPAVCAEKMHQGKLKLEGKFNDVDLRTIFDAVRSAPDNEFVTVEKRDESVRVAKSGGNLLIKVHEKHGKHGDNEKVEVKIPLSVVQALLSGKDDELDVAAGIRALAALGDVELINVNDDSQTVHIWTDTKNSSD
jgi:hypothetical protein